MFTNIDDEKLLIISGLVLFDNDEIGFFADDSLIGYDVFPKSIGTCVIGEMHWQYGEGKKYPNVDAIIDRFFKGKRFLNSMEELVDYLNAYNSFDRHSEAL